MPDEKQIVEKKLGCPIEEFVIRELEFFEKNKIKKCERKNPFLEFTREDFYFLKRYCIDHNLAIIY
jgi:hypothetical protein